MSNGRFYRETIKNKDISSFTVNIKETDLWIAVDSENYSDELCELLQDHILEQRHRLENYIRKFPEFRNTLSPYLIGNPGAPDIVMQMVRAGNTANVGPMAAVAGAFAESAGRYLLNRVSEVIVENGGDIFLKSSAPCRIGIYAGNSSLSGNIAIEIAPGDTPLGVCTSSGTVGHSFSRGKADAVVVVSPSTPLADAAATALGNEVRSKDNMEEVVDIARGIEGVSGVLVICDDRMAAWGKVKICPAAVKEKIYKEWKND